MKEAFPLIKTERLLLRQFTDNDLENVFTGLSDPNVIRYYGVNYKTLEDTKLQIKYFADLEQNDIGIWWAVCAVNNQTFYGAIGLNNLMKQHKKAEIGFWLLPDFWGTGIMSEAVPLVCDYGFSHFGLHRIEAIVETKNTNSKKIMEKMQFTHEGTMKDAEIKDGKFISLDLYAKINTRP